MYAYIFMRKIKKRTRQRRFCIRPNPKVKDLTKLYSLIPVSQGFRPNFELYINFVFCSCLNLKRNLLLIK